jgi:hypothetical protein
MPIPLVAMFDTGSGMSVVRQGIPAQLGLRPIGLIHAQDSSGLTVYPEYLVRFTVGDAAIETIVVEALSQDLHVQCLLGRDVLSVGIFVYIGYDNTFSLSF